MYVCTYVYIYIWIVYIHIDILISDISVKYNDLTVTPLEIMVHQGNHPQMALIQVSELLSSTQIYVYNVYCISMYIYTYIVI